MLLSTLLLLETTWVRSTHMGWVRICLIFHFLTDLVKFYFFVPKLTKEAGCHREYKVIIK